MINCQGVELIPAKIDHLSQDIFTKAPKHRLHLFGCYDRDSHDSDSQPPKSVDDLDSFGVKAKVAWSAIKAKINGGSAVLVVDELFCHFFASCKADNPGLVSGRRFSSRSCKLA